MSGRVSKSKSPSSRSLRRDEVKEEVEDDDDEMETPPAPDQDINSSDEDENELTDSEDDEPEAQEVTITVWSRRRSAYPFSKYFSEALEDLASRNFIVNLQEVDHISKKALTNTQLLWLQGGESGSLRDSEQRALVEHVLRGGSLLANVFYPPSSYRPGGSADTGSFAARVRKNVDKLLGLFGLEGVEDERFGRTDIVERHRFCNRLETLFREKPNERRKFAVGPFVDLFSRVSRGSTTDLTDKSQSTASLKGASSASLRRQAQEDPPGTFRSAFLPRGAFGLGQVLFLSNMHCFANEKAWSGGLIKRNNVLLANLVRMSTRRPPSDPAVCRLRAIRAAEKGDLSGVIKGFKVLQELEKGDPLVYEDEEDDDDAAHGYDTALHSAAASGNLPIIRFLVEENFIPVGFQQHDMETAVHAAARVGNLTVIKFLVERYKADLLAPNRRGHMPIHVCARSWRTDNLEQRFAVVRYFVEQGIDIDIPSTVNKATPLFGALASAKPPIEMIKFLVEQMKANIDVVNRDGWHPLLVACNNHDDETVVKLLIQWKIDPVTTVLPQEKQNGLHRALLNGRVKVAKFLGENYPALIAATDVNEYTCLHFAARGGHLELLKWMLTKFPKKADAFAVDKHGKTILHVAIIHSRGDVVRYLLKEYPKLLDVRSTNGWAALSFACRAGSLSMAELLLEHPGVDVNTRSEASPKDTPLLLAMKYGHWDVAAFLVGHADVDVTAADDAGWTPIHLALDRSSSDRKSECPLKVIQSIFDKGVNPYEGLKRPGQPAKQSERKEDDEAETPADPETPSEPERHWSPLTLASKAGRTDVVNYLLQLGPGGRRKKAETLDDPADNEKSEKKKKKKREKSPSKKHSRKPSRGSLASP